MKPKDEAREALRAALEDPAKPFDPSLRSQLNVEEAAQLQMHQILDRKLGHLLAEVRTPLDARAPDIKSLRNRVEASLSAAPGDSGYLATIRWRERWAALGEWFHWDEDAKTRWAPALILLLLLPALPILLQTQRESQGSIEMADAKLSSPGEPGLAGGSPAPPEPPRVAGKQAAGSSAAPTAPAEGKPPRAAKPIATAAPKADKSRTEGQTLAGSPPAREESRSVAADAEPGPRASAMKRARRLEQAPTAAQLEKQLLAEKSTSGKRRILKQLETLYEQQKNARKLSEVRAKLKAL